MAQIAELLAYNANVFDHSHLNCSDFPLPSGPHVLAWKQYMDEAQSRGVFETLKLRLVQLRFEVREGISQTAMYRAATLRGMPVDDRIIEKGLVLQVPEVLELAIHQSPAGEIPVIIAPNRTDFVSLVQSLAMRNEPKLVPESMGACMIKGFNNWDRIGQYRKCWEGRNPNNCSEADWKTEFQRIIPQKELYQDHFMILSDGPYSGVPAEEIGLSEQEWKHISRTIRREHECTHYFTERVFNSMRNNLIDELIADYMGITIAIGKYKSDWFLRFLGLESWPDFRSDGRLQNYRGTPPLSDGSFKILQLLVKTAAENLEKFDMKYSEELHHFEKKLQLLIALTYFTLEELASDQMPHLLEKDWYNLSESIYLKIE